MPSYLINGLNCEVHTEASLLNYPFWHRHNLNLHDSSVSRHVNAASRKSLEIQAYSNTKTRTLLKLKFV